MSDAREVGMIRKDLPQLPPRMRSLPIDHRGYPVPYFVAWIDGKPDHRVMDAGKLPVAVRDGLCWMCGKKLGGRPHSFAIGPMCSITRTISEPPSHMDCLRFAVRACPWMTRPHAKRREAGLPEDLGPMSGVGLKRNPGVICLWTTPEWRPYRDDRGGVLFRLGNPVATEWYAEGRAATKREVQDSIESGLPLLTSIAEAEDRERPGEAR